MRSGAAHSSGGKVNTLKPAHRELDYIVPKGLVYTLKAQRARTQPPGDTVN